MTQDAPFLELRNLSVEMRDKARRIRVLDDVSLSIRRGTTMGVVGESGCGKSMTALAIMRLLPPGFEITSGQILLDGEDITHLPEARMRALRGNDISMIFQEPMTSLNPVFTVGDQIAEAVHEHQNVSRAEAAARALDMLRAVQIPAAESRLNAYPHEFSGGMRQRVMIAMALACTPRLQLGRAALAATPALVEVPGMVPELGKMPRGCRFAPRCRAADQTCRESPPQRMLSASHAAACWKATQNTPEEVTP